MQLAGVACCGHGDKTSLFIVRGQKPLTRTEREREREIMVYYQENVRVCIRGSLYIYSAI